MVVGGSAMIWILVILGLLLLLGPLRRPLLRHARVSVPLVLGAVGGALVGLFAAGRAGLGAPESMALMLALAVGFGLGFGQACKRWCDQYLGPRDNHNDRR